MAAIAAKSGVDSAADSRRAEKQPPAAATQKPLWELHRFQFEQDPDNHDTRTVESWATFVKEESHSGNATCGSPLIYWNWRLPAAERYDWNDFSVEDRAAYMSDPDELSDSVCLYFMRLNGCGSMRAYCFKIRVHKINEPEIREFIARHAFQPFA